MSEWIQLRILSVTVLAPFGRQRQEGCTRPSWGEVTLDLSWLSLFDPLAGRCLSDGRFLKKVHVCAGRHACTCLCLCILACACTHMCNTSVYMNTCICVRACGSVCVCVPGSGKAETGVKQRICIFTPGTKPGHKPFSQLPFPPPCVTPRHPVCECPCVQGVCTGALRVAQGGHTHVR